MPTLPQDRNYKQLLPKPNPPTTQDWIKAEVHERIIRKAKSKEYTGTRIPQEGMAVVKTLNVLGPCGTRLDISKLTTCGLTFPYGAWIVACARHKVFVEPNWEWRMTFLSSYDWERSLRCRKWREGQCTATVKCRDFNALAIWTPISFHVIDFSMTEVDAE